MDFYKKPPTKLITFSQSWALAIPANLDAFHKLLHITQFYIVVDLYVYCLYGYHFRVAQILNFNCLNFHFFFLQSKQAGQARVFIIRQEIAFYPAVAQFSSNDLTKEGFGATL